MGVIIYTLMSGPKRFHEITEGIPGISDRLLTERLNELIKEGLVTKKQLEPSTIIGYELTDSGMELKEVITAIRNWMAKRTNL